jgi:hypothetical protein
MWEFSRRNRQKNRKNCREFCSPRDNIRKKPRKNGNFHNQSPITSQLPWQEMTLVSSDFANFQVFDPCPSNWIPWFRVSASISRRFLIGVSSDDRMIPARNASRHVGDSAAFLLTLHGRGSQSKQELDEAGGSGG